jgi:6-phosphogluconolactonase (cycloisomerase 2 family)
MPTDQLSGNLGWLPGTGGLITSLAPDPKGRFLYALSVSTSSFGIPIGKNGLSAFTIDRNSGALTLIGGSPYDVPRRGGDIAVTGDGQRLVLLSNGTLTSYSIDQTTGALSRISSTSVPGTSVATSWDGQFVFAGARDGRVTSLKIAADGTLSEVNHVDAQNSGQLVLSYTGKYLYSSGEDAITVIGVGSSGDLSILQANFAGWRRVGTSRDDRFVYLSRDATDVAPGAVETFQFDATTGAIGNAVGTPTTFPNGDFPYIRTDYSGGFLIVALSSEDFLDYPINQDGSFGSPNMIQGTFIGPQFFVEVP